MQLGIVAAGVNQPLEFPHLTDAPSYKPQPILKFAVTVSNSSVGFVNRVTLLFRVGQRSVLLRFLNGMSCQEKLSMDFSFLWMFNFTLPI